MQVPQNPDGVRQALPATPIDPRFLAMAAAQQIKIAQVQQADKAEGFSWSGVLGNRNKGMPSYKLPRESDVNKQKVIEDFLPKQKSYDAKGAAEAEENYDRALDRWRDKVKNGDMLLLHNEDGNQFWHRRDDKSESGWAPWFPSVEQM